MYAAARRVIDRRKASDQAWDDAEWHKPHRNTLGQANGQDHVIEAAERRKFRIHHATVGIYNDVIRIYADLFQHGAEQSGFVLAVPVLMRKTSAAMGLEPPIPVDGDVADIALHIGGDGLHLRDGVGNSRSIQTLFVGAQARDSAGCR